MACASRLVGSTGIPHFQHTVDPTYWPPTGPEFSHLSWLEPLKLPDICFSGDSGSLTSFLRTVRDFLRPRASLFQSQTQRVVWISGHFGYQTSENHKVLVPSQNWYNSLVIDNTWRQGVVDPYADLDGIEFVHPTLLSVQDFLEGLILVFGD
ncbi:hypothetical protein VP01_1566g11 [Puccinia sorghi]|uniref:Uncharacterized protein n=1 Tax=Puccinia sorghi TaxID=27349 RepID=A0A0L6VI32_9BASI|nr:hypothetical protein VP01_1566g11 [Puccinia sorghi]